MTYAASILVVDDQPRELRLIESVLGELPIHLVTATGGRDALAAAADHDLALAILDVQMPGMDGYALAEALRAEPRTARLPVIFLTGAYGEQEHLFKGYEAGAVDYLFKPCDPRVLRSKVNVFLELARHRTSLEQLVQERTRELAERNRELEREVARRERLHAAIEHSAEAILITDAEGVIEYVNPAFERMTGYTRDEAIGARPTFLRDDADDTDFYRKVWNTLAMEETWHGMIRDHRKDGAPYIQQLVISPVRSGTGAITHYVATQHDVTDDLAREVQLRQAQRLESIGTLAGGVAHQINNPIMGIINYADLILGRRDDPDNVAEYAGEIRHEATRVATIVRHLLEFSRQETDLASTPVDLREVVQAALALVDGVIREDQITLEVDLPDDLPAVLCGERQMEQVLLSLLTNARDALNAKYAGFHRDKIARIRARRNGDSVCLCVEDQGVGIPDEVREHLFEPFYTTKDRTTGTGLGLAIAHRICADHGATISVDSTTGECTRFSFCLPVAR